MSEPKAITGWPDPHRATHAVGMPATPSCTVKPFSRSSRPRYFCVSTSWKPISPKLNTMSFICWPRSNIAGDETSESSSAFSFATLGSTLAAGAGLPC